MTFELRSKTACSAMEVSKEPSGGWGRGLQRKSEKAQSARESMLRLLATIKKKRVEKKKEQLFCRTQKRRQAARPCKCLH